MLASATKSVDYGGAVAVPPVIRMQCVACMCSGSIAHSRPHKQVKNSQRGAHRGFAVTTVASVRHTDIYQSCNVNYQLLKDPALSLPNSPYIDQPY